MLEPNGIIEYLIEHGLVTRRDVVDGDIKVSDVSKRNHNYIVEVSGRTGYFIKQSEGDVSNSTLANEGAIYRRLSARASSLKFLPRYINYDPSLDILITELARNAETLREYQLRRKILPLTFAGRIGHILGAIHAARFDPLEVPSKSVGLPTNIPTASRVWASSFLAPSLTMLQETSGAAQQLIRIVQATEIFAQLLGSVWEQPGVTGLIHGDMRWDNWLVEHHGRRDELMLIDWEIGGEGEIAWDIGALLAELVTTWVRSIPLTTGMPMHHQLEFAYVPIASLQLAAGKFWRAYLGHHKPKALPVRALLNRSMVFVALKLIQNAFEYEQETTSLTRDSVALLQIAANIGRSPAAAAGNLLGLPSEGLG